MSTITKFVSKNYKDIAILLLVLFFMPIINVLIKIIFTYGTYFGTYARLIMEYGLNF